MAKKPVVVLIRGGQRVPYRGQPVFKGGSARCQSGAQADTIDVDAIFANFPKRGDHKTGHSQQG